jgi:hypothetical protein
VTAAAVATSMNIVSGRSDGSRLELCSSRTRISASRAYHDQVHQLFTKTATASRPHPLGRVSIRRRSPGGISVPTNVDF